MKSVKIVIASVACAALALGAVSLPAGAASGTQAAGTLSSPLPPPTSGACTARAVVNIRSGPSNRNRVVGRLPRKGEFTITNRSGRWVQGTSKWGNGWVMAVLLRCPK